MKLNVILTIPFFIAMVSCSEKSSNNDKVVDQNNIEKIEEPILINTDSATVEQNAKKLYIIDSVEYFCTVDSIKKIVDFGKDILSMEVLIFTEETEELYGEKAKNGVIIIDKR